MAQPSVAAFFSTRKRAATEEITRQRNKVLLLDDDQSARDAFKGVAENTNKLQPDLVFIGRASPIATASPDSSGQPATKCNIKRNNVVTKLSFDSLEMVSPKANACRRLLQKSARPLRHTKQPDIHEMFSAAATKPVASATIETNVSDPREHNGHGPYPTTPTKKLSTMDQIASRSSDLSLAEIKTKLSRSTRLAELKASIARIHKSADTLREIEKVTSQIGSPNSTLKSFKTIQLDIPASPQKTHQSPVKAYLSPAKQSTAPQSSPTKNVAGPSSPSKLAAYQRYAGLASPEKPSLTLPFKYRCLAEIFRCLDSVSAMYYNRKEIITFKKLRHAVQEMLRKNFTEQHLEQIKFIYPDSYVFTQEKMRNFGSTSKQEKYELVVTPQLHDNDQVTANCEKMGTSVLLERRRKLFNLLIERVKDFHQEFLESLDPPMTIPRTSLTRWHPEFDIEQIPDVERAAIPPPPNVETYSTAKDILSKAKNLFNCNTRMETALQRLAEKQRDVEEEKSAELTTNVNKKPEPPLSSALKGIPKNLLEKVRARQAAKALEAMTRTPAKDKEAMQYAQLPELAKFTRNIFISERKGVLPIESIINKLNNSFRTSLTPSELEELLRLLSTLLPGWIVFHEIRKAVYVKLAKDADMTKILNKLEQVAKDKAD